LEKHPRLNPRKRPTQKRSQATVDDILEAAAYILERDGWKGFTTNAVADKAGVNISSLYQYFPNKESIVLELRRRHGERVQECFTAPKGRVPAGATLRDMLHMLVEAGVREHRVAPALHRIFSEEIPSSAFDAYPAWEAHMAREWAHRMRPLFRGVPHPEMAIFVAQTVGHAVVHEAANRRPELLKSPAFIDEVVTLLERYLRRDASGRH
jgi:AcrR family transcriptional regulator